MGKCCSTQLSSNEKSYSTHSVWERLEPAPFIHFNGPIKYNETEFLSSNYDKNGANGLYVYNIIDNNWSKIIDCKQEIISGAKFGISDDKSILYFARSSKSGLHKINLNNKTISIKYGEQNFGAHPTV